MLLRPACICNGHQSYSFAYLQKVRNVRKQRDALLVPQQTPLAGGTSFFRVQALLYEIDFDQLAGLAGLETLDLSGNLLLDPLAGTWVVGVGREWAGG